MAKRCWYSCSVNEYGFFSNTKSAGDRLDGKAERPAYNNPAFVSRIFSLGIGLISSCWTTGTALFVVVAFWWFGLVLPCVYDFGWAPVPV